MPVTSNLPSIRNGTPSNACLPRGRADQDCGDGELEKALAQRAERSTGCRSVRTAAFCAKVRKIGAPTPRLVHHVTSLLDTHWLVPSFIFAFAAKAAVAATRALVRSPGVARFYGAPSLFPTTNPGLTSHPVSG